MNSIFDLLLFSLQKNLSSNIVDLLTSALTTLDIVEIVIYKKGQPRTIKETCQAKLLMIPKKKILSLTKLRSSPMMNKETCQRE